MTSRLMSLACVAFLLALLNAWPTGPTAVQVRAQGPDVGTDAQREAGKTLYAKYCVQCHGEKGDGNGYATQHLYPRPRDFTTGKFKVRTTPNGALPTHEDLERIIRIGMPYTSMPAWPGLTDDEVSNLAYYVKTFSADFSNPELIPKPVELPNAPGSTPESIELGKKLYVDNGCIKCHGNLGRSDGPSAPSLTDDYGYPIRAANLAQRWTFRGGSSREDIFRTMSTGLNGTPMPSFADALPPDQRWAITDYIASLSPEQPGYTNLVVAKYVLDTIDLAKGAASFESAPVARLPIVGQIMEPGRQFNPPATSVAVQAIYDADSIAFLVRWDDMGADRTGKNDPTQQVPLEEELVKGATAASGGATADNPFGDQQVTQPPAAADPFAESPATATVPPSEFSDAVAIQIPTATPTSARKPYFIFGDGQNSVDLWFYDLARPEPLQFTARGSAAIEPNDTGDVTGAASYTEGEWSVIFKRPLRAS